ncbi:LysR family transcriptional regulator [Spiractinospora alimapuensis]|uniref:LysR family transcriptional regulator n=1 Tax=Spiractinospora alimapuensis TaxID=2820884 RepID=UPI001F38AB8E|nr:LysR family transcriptional regulator [Spiractinospora alimapuensis]QVQ50844.1 LysR family transcriptional regulator [Spiractinospora alimapuensis]
MRGLEIRELECFLVLAEELHFGRAGVRLRVSQGRVSQMLGQLERRMGVRLIDRTSRRVRLTPFGGEFLASLRPAYDHLDAVVTDAQSAARGVRSRLRLGFQGAILEPVTSAMEKFRRTSPECQVEIVELPYSDPFGALRRREVDAAVVLLPVQEDDLTVGVSFSEQPQTLAVSTRHPFARLAEVSAEDLTRTSLVEIAGPAPRYWTRVQAPHQTPSGRAIPHGDTARTFQEALSLIAADRGAMLMCASTAALHSRPDIVNVPVTGLDPSILGLAWPEGNTTSPVREFAAALATCARRATPGDDDRVAPRAPVAS